MNPYRDDRGRYAHPWTARLLAGMSHAIRNWDAIERERRRAKNIEWCLRCKALIASNDEGHGDDPVAA